MLSDLYKDILIIGGNTSGLAAASQVKRVNSKLDVTVLESGNYISYGSCGLPYFISGEIQKVDDLIVYPKEFFEEKRKIKILLKHKVISINPLKKEVYACNSLNSESMNYSNTIAFNYDRLIICSGALPIKLNVAGSESRNIFYLRSAEDAENIKNFIIQNNPRKAAVIGGGSVGILVAEALSKMGIKVIIIESKDKIYNEYEDEITSIFNKVLKSHNIEIITNSNVNSFIFNKSTNLCYGINGFTKLENTKENFYLETDIVIISSGIKANTSFLNGTFIELGEKDAIKVTPKQQTSITNIYAAGDCALVKNIITKKLDYIPTANNAIKTGRIAGANVAGEDEQFKGSVATKIDNVFNYEIASTGISMTKAKEFRFNILKITDTYPSHIKALPGANDITITLIVDKGTKKILGAQMIGKEGVAKRIDIFATAITQEMTVDDVYMLDLSYTPFSSTAPDAVNKICGKAALLLKQLCY